MSLFDPSREQKTIEALRELVKGCARHPAYRYKRKPTCKKCLALFGLAQALREYEEIREKALPIYFAARAKEDKERYFRDQERLNCPG